MNADFGPKSIYNASTARAAKNCAVSLKAKHTSFSFITEGRTVIVIGDHSKPTLEGYATECLKNDPAQRIANASALVNRSRGVNA